MRVTTSFAACLALLIGSGSQASLITQLTTADTTPNADVLDGMLFLDAAAIGGGDTNLSSTAVSTARMLDLNGAAGAPGVEGTLSIQGFAFATGGNVTDAAISLTFTFTYLGLDGVSGGLDDVVIGTSEAVTFNDGASGNSIGYEGAGRYYVNFDTPPTAVIDGLNENFLVTITPSGGNIRFKTTTGTFIGNAKFSISGSFVSVPEPSTFLAFGFASIAAYSTKRTRK